MFRLPVCPHCRAVYRYGEVNRMIFFHPARVRTCYHCKKSMKPLLRGLFLLAAIYLAVCFGSTIAIVNIFPNATALTVFIVNICWTVLLFALRPFFKRRRGKHGSGREYRKKRRKYRNHQG